MTPIEFVYNLSPKKCRLVFQKNQNRKKKKNGSVRIYPSGLLSSGGEEDKKIGSYF